MILKVFLIILYSLFCLIFAPVIGLITGLSTIPHVWASLNKKPDKVSADRINQDYQKTWEFKDGRMN